MSERIITSNHIEAFRQYLYTEEKSSATIEKYIRDVTAFSKYAGLSEITKELLITYKKKLIAEGYAARSVNSMLASINSLLLFLGWTDCKVKSMKLQRQIYCPEERELSEKEYFRLVRTAESNQNMRLSMILQTIGMTGIRISELPFITVEAAKSGNATVSCKAKTRAVFLSKKLRKKLLRYAASQGIETGCIFITRSGRPVSRTNVWREMKALCRQANVNPQKVFPHNLRHLFARMYYKTYQNIAQLADILGHSSIDTTRIYIISTGREHQMRIEGLHLLI